VRISQGELEGIALEICPETHTHDLKLFFKAMGDPTHHIRDETSRQALKRSGGALVIGALNENLPPIYRNRNCLRKKVNEKTLGSCHFYLGGITGDFHFLG
jgi:hypothetical protein